MKLMCNAQRSLRRSKMRRWAPSAPVRQALSRRLNLWVQAPGPKRAAANRATKGRTTQSFGCGMKNVAVVARKGGSGKTTVTVNLAIAAFRRGYGVRLVDTDPQGSSSESLKVRQGDGPQILRMTGEEAFELNRAPAPQGIDTTFIDTPAASEDAIGHAIAIANLSLLIVRPTFLDLAAALQTAQILRRLRKPGLIVLNQAPVPRGGVEPPAVKRAQEALRLMQLPVVPVVLRARASYQNSLATGQSVEEVSPGNPAGEEIAGLWSYIERFAFGGARNASAVA